MKFIDFFGEWKEALFIPLWEVLLDELLLKIGMILLGHQSDIK
jgi:hypothetical protein